MSPNAGWHDVRQGCLQRPGTGINLETIRTYRIIDCLCSEPFRGKLQLLCQKGDFCVVHIVSLSCSFPFHKMLMYRISWHLISSSSKWMNEVKFTKQSAKSVLKSLWGAKRHGLYVMWPVLRIRLLKVSAINLHLIPNFINCCLHTRRNQSPCWHKRRKT